MGNAVSDKEVAHVKMSCALGIQQSAIFLKEDGTLVVLMEGGFFEIENLSMEKLFIQSRSGMESLAMMSLVLVELWVLSFCFKELETIIPLPRVVQNPECLWKLE